MSQVSTDAINAESASESTIGRRQYRIWHLLAVTTALGLALALLRLYPNDERGGTIVGNWLLMLVLATDAICRGRTVAKRFFGPVACTYSAALILIPDLDSLAGLVEVFPLLPGAQATYAFQLGLSFHTREQTAIIAALCATFWIVTYLAARRSWRWTVVWAILATTVAWIGALIMVG